VPRFGPLSFVILPVQSVAFVSPPKLFVTYAIKLLAVLLGSNTRPVIARDWPPLFEVIVVIDCALPSVPSALIVQRWISPWIVVAYSL